MVPEMAFKIRGPGLGFRKKTNPDADPNELCRQLQFGKCGFTHTVIEMSEPMNEPSQPEMARLVPAMPM